MRIKNESRNKKVDKRKERRKRVVAGSRNFLHSVVNSIEKRGKKAIEKVEGSTVK